MTLQQPLARDPQSWLCRAGPEDPVYFFNPITLRETAKRFLDGFPGEVTYAVKANPHEEVLETLAEVGLEAFDVASPIEMALVNRARRSARLHYHNPVRSKSEVAQGRQFGITSWSIDRHSELDKLGDIAGAEIAVRLKLPVEGASYDFGRKFGADPETAVELLKTVVARGGVSSITFHPGTQCHDAGAWEAYIQASADVAKRAGVTLHRLNVGGGFPSHRCDRLPDLQKIFATIAAAKATAFDGDGPALVCEPGRGMVAEAFQLALQVKAVCDDTIFLNDGIYGGLSEWKDIGASSRVSAVAASGSHGDKMRDFTVFGPTCDSIDTLPETISLPADLKEGDYLLFDGMGAYSTALATRFNGFGDYRIVTLTR